MTDLEIDRRLALAIGWKERQCADERGFFYVNTSDNYTWDNKWRVFSHKDWNVIGPIGEQYDCFPVKDMYSEWVAGKYPYVYADTPQKAIALAVIESVK